MSFPSPDQALPDTPSSSEGPRGATQLLLTRTTPRTALMLCPGRLLPSICLDLLNNPVKGILSIPILQLGKLRLQKVKFQGHGVSGGRENPGIPTSCPVLPARLHHLPSACTHTYAPARTLVGPPSLPTGRGPMHTGTTPSLAPALGANSSQILPSPAPLC